MRSNYFSPLSVSGHSSGAGSEVIIVDEVSFVRVLRGPETWRREEDRQINIVVESYRVGEPLGQLQWSGEARSALHSGTVPQCPAVSGERMFWEKSRQRTNHQRGKTEENTTLMIGPATATNTDLVLYCTVP